MTASELAGRYWDLQDYIVGFAIVQMVATLIAIATSKEMADGVRLWHRQIAWTMIATGCLYILAVVLAFFAARHLSLPLFREFPCIMSGTLVARVLAIATANGLGVIVVYYMVTKGPRAA